MVPNPATTIYNTLGADGEAIIGLSLGGADVPRGNHHPNAANPIMGPLSMWPGDYVLYRF